jgi:hypothetical protein
MVTATPVYGTGTAVTINLASLASSAVDVGVQSDAINMSTLNVLDMWIGGKITAGTTPTANTRIEVWFMPAYDGTSYVGGAFGDTAAAVTFPSTTFPAGGKAQGRLAASIPCLAATTGQIFRWGVLASEIFGGMPPPKFVVFMTHNLVAALNATAGNHELRYITAGVASA